MAGGHEALWQPIRDVVGLHITEARGLGGRRKEGAVGFRSSDEGERCVRGRSSESKNEAEKRACMGSERECQSGNMVMIISRGLFRVLTGHSWMIYIYGRTNVKFCLLNVKFCLLCRRSK